MAHNRSGLQADDTRDEILAAACIVLDKAHELLSRVVFYGGNVPPQLLPQFQAWVDDEYDPGTHRAKPCAHNWAKVVLGGEIMCTRCGIQASTDVQ